MEIDKTQWKSNRNLYNPIEILDIDRNPLISMLPQAWKLRVWKNKIYTQNMSVSLILCKILIWIKIQHIPSSSQTQARLRKYSEHTQPRLKPDSGKPQSRLRIDSEQTQTRLDSDSIQTQSECFCNTLKCWISVLKPDCRHNLLIEMSFLNQISTKKNRKKHIFKFSFQYLENDPLNALNLIVDTIYG